MYAGCKSISKLLNRQETLRRRCFNTCMCYPLALMSHPLEELEVALSKMKRGRAGAKIGILPQLVLFGGAVFWDRLLELMQDMYRGKGR